MTHRHMPDGRLMQCKDIPDDAFLQAVRDTPALDGSTNSGGWRMCWEVRPALEAVTGPLPDRLFRAKGISLVRRGLMGGCGCGDCRGDWHLPEGCPDELCCHRLRVINWCACPDGGHDIGTRLFSRSVPTSTLLTAEGRQREAEQLHQRVEAWNGPTDTITIHAQPHPDDHLHQPPGKYKWLTATDSRPQ